MMLDRTIRERRKAIGLNQEEIANRIGVSKDSIRRWESGEREPRASELQSLAMALQTSVAYLLGDTSDSRPMRPVGASVDNAVPIFEPPPEKLTLPQEEVNHEILSAPKAPAEIINDIAAINAELGTTIGLFTDKEIQTAEMLLHLCLDNFATEGDVSLRQETAS